MPAYNFHQKKFRLLANTAAGRVGSDTYFTYQQAGELVTADYEGGGIKYGKIIALLKGDQLDMRYQCLTEQGELLSGKAIADISLDQQNKIRLDLQWQWLEDSSKSGNSVYKEV